MDANGVHLATLISSLEELAPGHTFPTDREDELQLGLFNHPHNHEIKRHYHPSFNRSLKFTHEVLVIMSGLVQVDIYDGFKELVASRNLGPNSVAILRQGGHGFKLIQKSIIIEVKQGPYAGDADKVLF